MQIVGISFQLCLFVCLWYYILENICRNSAYSKMLYLSMSQLCVVMIQDSIIIKVVVLCSINVMFYAYIVKMMISVIKMFVGT